uniref:Glutamate rich 2 n=1 Tax=Monopterus albus TaxID=43700 RepID=A0A3Q3Q6Q9_MONAL
MHKANMEDEQAEEEDDEDRKAPVELLVEFLQAVKDRDLQLASKQCQMILFYEPDHPEASQFLPLIQKKLLEGEEEEEDGDADDSDDSRSDEESSLSSSVWSSSCSSSSLAGEEEEERWVNKQEPSPPFNTSS